MGAQPVVGVSVQQERAHHVDSEAERRHREHDAAVDDHGLSQTLPSFHEDEARDDQQRGAVHERRQDLETHVAERPVARRRCPRESHGEHRKAELAVITSTQTSRPPASRRSLDTIGWAPAPWWWWWSCVWMWLMGRTYPRSGRPVEAPYGLAPRPDGVSLWAPPGRTQTT